MTQQSSIPAEISTLAVLGTNIARTDYRHAASVIGCWAERGESRYVCVACVNNVMEAYDSASFSAVTNEADLTVPDGMPVVWALRLLGHRAATRVYGPNLTLHVLDYAEKHALRVGFYGGTREVLDRLLERLRRDHPGLQVAYSFAPPFRPVTGEEEAATIDAIHSAGVQILFIGLGTPKQDLWMAAHRSRLRCVTVGVGAAFDFLSGVKPQAPGWMQASGLEWAFRLCTEPRRLWKRYLKHNPRFIVLLALQVARATFAPAVRRTES